MDSGCFLESIGMDSVCFLESIWLDSISFSILLVVLDMQKALTNDKKINLLHTSQCVLGNCQKLFLSKSKLALNLTELNALVQGPRFGTDVTTC
jgi:hypothetical protein